MSRIRLTVRGLMAVVAISGVFAWGCLGVSQGLRYHHLAIAFAAAAGLAVVGAGPDAERRTERSS